MTSSTLDGTASPTGPSRRPIAGVPPRRLIAFIAMVFGMFMAILDIQIVSASLKEIQAGLAASSDEISWVQTAYLIAEVVMIPLSGFLSRALSTRVFFTIAAAGFTAASAMCAFSGSINAMIFWRAVQGFIGGGMIPGVFAAAFTVFPPEKRSFVSPLIGLVATLAPTIGPTVGGYLSDTFSWHWLFLVNVGPGIAVSLAAWLLIDFDQPERGLLSRFDWTGLVGLAAFLGSMEYVLEEGPRNDWFDDNVITYFTLLMVAGAILFFWRALTRPEPIVDLSAYKNRNFAFGSLFSFALGIGLYGLTYIYPLFLASIRDFDSLMIGQTMFVTGACMLVTAPFAGILSKKIDMRLMLMLGFVGFGLGTYIATGITADWSFNELLVPQILRGVSLMLCMVPINNIALGTLPPEKLKSASGLYNLNRNLGGAVGLAVITTVLNNRTDLHITQLHETLRMGNVRAEETLAGLAQRFADHGSDAEHMALKQLTNLAHRQAQVFAFGDVFLLLSVLFVSLSAITFVMQKPSADGEVSGH